MICYIENINFNVNGEIILKKKIIRSVIILIPVILCMGIIFYFSSQNSTQSDNVSQNFTEEISRIVFKNFEFFSPGFQNTIIFELNMFIRKAAHFFVFFLMSAFIYAELTVWMKKYLLNGLITTLFCTIYAILDEFHQSFTPGRTPLLKDVFIDTAGAVLGVIFCFSVISVIYFLNYIFKKNNSSRLSAS